MFLDDLQAKRHGYYRGGNRQGSKPSLPQEGDVNIYPDSYWQGASHIEVYHKGKWRRGNLQEYRGYHVIRETNNYNNHLLDIDSKGHIHSRHIPASEGDTREFNNQELIYRNGSWGTIKEGDTRTQNGQEQEYKGGSWVDKATPTPAPSGPNEGDERTNNAGVRQVYQNGKWIAKSSISTPTPTVAEGTTRNGGTEIYKNGAWRAVQEGDKRTNQDGSKSTYTSGSWVKDGSTPAPTPTPSGPNEGDTRTHNGQQQVYRSGSWVNRQQSTPAPGPLTTTPQEGDRRELQGGGWSVYRNGRWEDEFQNGDTRVSNGQTQVYRDGSWVNQQATPTPAPTTTPQEGDTRTYSGQEQVYQSGQWVNKPSPTPSPGPLTTRKEGDRIQVLGGGWAVWRNGQWVEENPDPATVSQAELLPRVPGTGGPSNAYPGLLQGDWQSWTQQPDDKLLSDDFRGSFNEWWNRVISQLITDFYRGNWGSIVQGFLKTRQVPRKYYGIAADAETVVIDSPEVWEFVEDYVRWLLSSGHIKGSEVEQRFGLPGQRGQLQRATFSTEQQRSQELVNSLYLAWVTEGDSGVQKLIKQFQDEGRLGQLELGLFLDAQDTVRKAVERRKEYELSVVSLAQQVAQYDAALAANPVDWVRRGLWLRDRGVAITGLSLALAEIHVPPEQLDQASSTAPNRYSRSTQEVPVAGSPSINLPQRVPRAADAPPGPDPYRDVVKQMAASFQRGFESDRYSERDWQDRADQLQYGQGREPGVLAPEQNALGLRVGETRGHQVNARDYYRASAADRQMKGALVASTGRDPNQFREEIERHRPKGYVKGPLARR